MQKPIWHLWSNPNKPWHQAVPSISLHPPLGRNMFTRGSEHLILSPVRIKEKESKMQIDIKGQSKKIVWLNLKNLKSEIIKLIMHLTTSSAPNLVTGHGATVVHKSLSHTSGWGSGTGKNASCTYTGTRVYTPTVHTHTHAQVYWWGG